MCRHQYIMLFPEDSLPGSCHRRRFVTARSEGYLNGNGALKYPSRFIAEIPDELLTVFSQLAEDPGYQVAFIVAEADTIAL